MICSTVHPYGRAAFIPPPPPSQPSERRHSNDITSPNIKCLNRTAAWEKSYNADLGLSNPSMSSPLPKTTIFLNLGLVYFFLDWHHFWKDRRDWDKRRKDDIIINVDVMIPSPLQEEEKRRHITEALPKILTRNFWDAKEEEEEDAAFRFHTWFYPLPHCVMISVDIHVVPQ